MSIRVNVRMPKIMRTPMKQAYVRTRRTRIVEPWVASFTPYFTKNKKYYAYNSIQTFKRSQVYIQSKAPSSICCSVRNNNYNPFHVYDKQQIFPPKARCYQFGRKQGCVFLSSEVASIKFIKEVSCRQNCLLKVKIH